MDRGTHHGGCPGAHHFPNQPYPSPNRSRKGTMIESLFPCQYDEVKLGVSFTLSVDIFQVRACVLTYRYLRP